MIDPLQFRLLVIRPALQRLGLWSLAAERLLLGTALVESWLMYLKQKPGPALGLFQMEPATHTDIWRRYLRYRPGLTAKISGLTAVFALAYPPHERLMTDLDYATAMARVHYWRVPASLPAANDLAGLAAYWKAHFNTPEGKGDPESFIGRMRPFWNKRTLTLDHLPYN